QAQSRLRLNVMGGVMGMFRGYVDALNTYNIHTSESEAVRLIYTQLPKPEELSNVRYNAMSAAEKQEVMQRFDTAAEQFEQIARAASAPSVADVQGQANQSTPTIFQS